VWTEGGCRSWYLDSEGRNVAIWPGSSWGYRRATRRFDLDAYAVTARTTAFPRPRPAALDGATVAPAPLPARPGAPTGAP
jgi:hypothetical protein